ncbi:sugar ABC transporter ATP-binding protein [Iocasia frigidifontis]|nr:sugar ABC transporter ATP-binding protein [Iocasia fonsfrigidae]
MSDNLVINMKNITKQFPGVLALDNVDLEVKKGEIHVLLGENGAGKSTLMKVLTGAYQKSSGKIFLNGKEINLENPRHAMDLGISMIYQEFNLAPHLTVQENIFLGRESSSNILLDDKEMYRQTRKILDRLNVNISPKEKVKNLSVAYQQMVEIAKAVSINAQVIIMDEPTAALTAEEKNILFDIIRQLKSEGRSIIYISHLLEEIKQVGDQVTILRDGRKIDTVAASTDPDRLIELMVGREIKELYPKRNVKIGSEKLRVENLSRRNVISKVSFSVREGEILGIAGLVGSGRTEILRAIFGVDPITTGKIYVDNKEVKINSPKDAIEYGIGLVPESRKEQGLALDLAVDENISLSTLDNYIRHGLIYKQEERRIAAKYKDELKIKTPSLNQKVKFLSGGNQQKVVISKWLCSKSEILFFDEPTRGIDVGAKREIFKVMNMLAEQGTAIIMVSSYLPEILAMSDRIVVMSNGVMTGEIDGSEATQEKIMKYATRNMS